MKKIIIILFKHRFNQIIMIIIENLMGINSAKSSMSSLYFDRWQTILVWKAWKFEYVEFPGHFSSKAKNYGKKSLIPVVVCWENSSICLYETRQYRDLCIYISPFDQYTLRKCSCLFYPIALSRARRRDLRRVFAQHFEFFS